MDIAAGFSHLAAVSGSHAAAVPWHEMRCLCTVSNQLFALGLGVFGQLGRGSERKAVQARSPQLVDALRDKRIARVFCGDFFTAAVTGAPRGFCSAR